MTLEDNRRAALSAIGTYVAAVMAAVITFLAVSSTLFIQYTGGPDSWLFYVGFCLLIGAFTCGVTVLGRQILLLARDRLNPFDPVLRWFTITLVVFMISAVTMMGIFASHHVGIDEPPPKRESIDPGPPTATPEASVSSTSTTGPPREQHCPFGFKGADSCVSEPSGPAHVRP
ncbi:hypothetical protein ACFYP4_12895 [Streptomyces sp. NPDC005551]|uniref:hypothetical protein n=1 Tax=Streptomyces sp. NPDC005551 TaxID=3364725 RepID=UPI0036AF26C2